MPSNIRITQLEDCGSSPCIVVMANVIKWGQEVHGGTAGWCVIRRGRVSLTVTAADESYPSFSSNRNCVSIPTKKKQKTLSPHLLQWQKLTCSATKIHKLTVRPQLSARPTCDVPLENKRHLEWWSSSATETLRNYLETDFSAAYGSILQYSLNFFLRINDL